MANGTIHKPTSPSINFLTFVNASSITIPLLAAPSASNVYGVFLFNPHNSLMLGVRGGDTPTVTSYSTSGITVTASMSGTNLVLTPNSTIWGETLVILFKNF